MWSPCLFTRQRALKMDLNKKDEVYLVRFFCISVLCLGHLNYLYLLIATFQVVTFSSFLLIFTLLFSSVLTTQPCLTVYQSFVIIYLFTVLYRISHILTDL